MHEGSITTQIVDSVLKEARQRKATKVLEVELVIGTLTFLNPEQVKFWYEMLTRDTIMEGSKLRIEENQGTVNCPLCGYKGDFKYVEDSAFHIRMPTLECPKCGNVVEIVSGKECTIKKVKMIILGDES